MGPVSPGADVAAYHPAVHRQRRVVARAERVDARARRCDALLRGARGCGRPVPDSRQLGLRLHPPLARHFATWRHAARCNRRCHVARGVGRRGGGGRACASRGTSCSYSTSSDEAAASSIRRCSASTALVASPTAAAAVAWLAAAAASSADTLCSRGAASAACSASISTIRACASAIVVRRYEACTSAKRKPTKPHEQTSKQTKNKQTNKQTNKQAGRQLNERERTEPPEGSDKRTRQRWTGACVPLRMGSGRTSSPARDQ